MAVVFGDRGETRFQGADRSTIRRTVFFVCVFPSDEHNIVCKPAIEKTWSAEAEDSAGRATITLLPESEEIDNT